MQQTEHYNDRVVRQFALMTVVWGIVGMLVGVIGSRRPLHAMTWRLPTIPLTLTCKRSVEEST